MENLGQSIKSYGLAVANHLDLMQGELNAINNLLIFD